MESLKQTPRAARFALAGAVALLIGSVAYAALGGKDDPAPRPRSSRRW